MSTIAKELAVKELETGELPPRVARRLIFISHANPEDNPAAAWFATRLTLLGYEVWCDLKNTHGGESEFWLKVQRTIEARAAKFVYILSNASCDFERKRGIYKEVQTADNLHIDNFILPVRIEKLTRSLPILVNTGLYINGENWAAGLHDLVERLREDGVPRRSNIDFEKISSWWPAIAAEKLIRQYEEDELVSNLLPIKALPENIHFIKVFSDGNPISGFERLRKVLPKSPAFYAHGDYAVSFGSFLDFAELTQGLDFETAYTVDTQSFLTTGHEGSGVIPDVAHNILTYLMSEAWDAFMASKELSSRELGRNRRTLWYIGDGLIPHNRTSLTEPGKRKVPIQLVGSVKHYRKTYRWHAGVLATVDLRVHSGIVLSPKVVISPRYKSDDGELPVPIDDRKVQKKLGWWNQQWRQKLLAMLFWLADEQPEIVIPIGYQQLVLSTVPRSHLCPVSYKEVSDDDVINQTMETLVEHTDSP